MILYVILVTGSCCHLNPLWVITLMTFHTGILWDLSMHFNPFIATGDKAEHHLGIFNQALLMASMALYFLMFAGGPAVPRFLHKMTGVTKFWVVLHIIVKSG
jgi:hypothetical protein